MPIPRPPGAVKQDLDAIRQIMKRIERTYQWAYSYGLSSGRDGRDREQEQATGVQTSGVSDTTGNAVVSRQRALRLASDADAIVKGMLDESKMALGMLRGVFLPRDSQDEFDEAKRMGKDHDFPRTARENDIDTARAAQRRRKGRGEDAGISDLPKGET